MDSVINLGLPQIGEKIFLSAKTDTLIQCLEVSRTWKILAENVLLKRWKNRMLTACSIGNTVIVKLLLEHFNSEESRLNVKDKLGCTPFIRACFTGHKDVVKLLLLTIPMEILI